MSLFDAFKKQPKAANAARAADPVVSQLDRLKLVLDCASRGVDSGILYLTLTLENGTDHELSPAILILLARNPAWHLHDPRMGRWRVEFELRDFNKKVGPGASRAYGLSVKVKSTIKPGDGVWLSLTYRGREQPLLSNRVRVPDYD